MKRRETLRSFFLRNAAWRLQMCLIPALNQGKEQKKEIMRESFENCKQFYAVSL